MSVMIDSGSFYIFLINNKILLLLFLAIINDVPITSHLY